MRKVIYIAGLPHGGSTILDYTLSFHKDILGLGEVYGILKNKPPNFEETDNVCSCGSEISQCEFWGRYLNGESQGDYGEKYKRVLGLAGSLGKNVIVDSSKDLAHLTPLVELSKNGNVDLRVVFLTRDVRGWTKSIVDIEKKRGRRPKPYLYYFNLWYKKSREMQKYFRDHNVNFVQISYEDFCHKKNETMKKILDSASLSSTLEMLDEPNSHIAFGNRAKRNKEKAKHISYDNRWAHEYWLNAALLLMPHIFIWNKRNVYVEKD